MSLITELLGFYSKHMYVTTVRNKLQIETVLLLGVWIAFTALVGVAGCATTSPVVPIGNGNYELAGSSATALSSGAAQKVRLLQIANQYCNATGKQMVLVDATDINGQVGTGAWANGSAHAATAAASYHEGLFGDGASADASAADASYHSGSIHPGQKASADVVFRCQ